MQAKRQREHLNDPGEGGGEPRAPSEAGAATEIDRALQRSWSRCWNGIGASGTGHDVMRALLQAYGEPHRHYHSLQHLAECLSLLEQHRELAAHPAEVEMALWFHDAVYQPKRADNEARSAQWAHDVLSRAGVAPDVTARVTQNILATRHEALPLGEDQALLVDIDLAILAAQPGRFEQYESQVRAEYRWVPEFLYRRKRGEVLAQFLARDPIYSTPQLRAIFEQRARENLARSLQRLRR